MKKPPIALLMILIATLLLAGCDGQSYTRTNWTQTSLPGITQATLEIRLLAVTEPGAGLQCNDEINFQATGDPGAPFA